MMANENYIEWDELEKKINTLLETCQLKNSRDIKLALKDIVKEYQPQFE